MFQKKRVAAPFGRSKEAWARLIGTGVGALGGAALADPNEKGQGAALGGMLGYATGSGLSHLPASAQYAGKRFIDSSRSALSNLVSSANGPGPISSARDFLFGRPVGQNGARTLNVLERAGRAGKGMAARAFNVAAHFPKIADASVGVGFPGSPVSLSLRTRDERLPGMHRWVPRNLIERVHEDLDQGLDPADVLESERGRGSLLSPAMGGAAGAALAHFGLGGRGGAAAAGLGALLGAGAGSTVNDLSASNREDNALEALRGVLRERASVPAIRGQQHSTASSPPPLLVSVGTVDR
jgi:hypothetical protein